MRSLEVHIKDCILQTVTVFNDRAEVIRKIPISSLVSENGNEEMFDENDSVEFELNIRGITNSANKESYRVKGEKATIVEVVVDDRMISNPEKSEEFRKLSDELSSIALQITEATQVS